MSQISNKNFELIRKAKENYEANLLYGELFDAVKSNEIEKTKKLLKLGVKIQTRNSNESRLFDDNDDSLLHISAKLGYFEITEILLDAGLPVDIRNRNDHTPFQWAIVNENMSVLKLLLEHGADINTKDNEGDSAPIWAVNKRAYESTEFLVEHKARLDIYNNNGILPLHWAAYNGDNRMIDILVNKGDAQLDVKTKNNETPSECASAHGHIDTVNYLLKLAAQI